MDSHSKKHIIVGLSGGVDSSVAAFLLKEQGFHVEGIFMKNWEEEDPSAVCTAGSDFQDVQAVCDILQIECHSINFAAEYWEKVFTHFLNEYRHGRTPNPDILCNKEIKFNLFLQYAKQRGADAIATGHYARIYQNGQTFQLLKGLDDSKDQSYFLHALNQSQLSHSLFPLGDLTKKTVREIAKTIGLPNFAKKDSTGICFIGERRFKEFLSHYLPAQPGRIQTTEGQDVGQHDGLMFYTIGQRQGLQIGGRKDSLDAPWYVVEKDCERNVLIVAQGSQHSALYASALYVDAIHWIDDGLMTFPRRLFAKTRYRQTDQACMIEPFNSHQYRVQFDTPQRAITPGQSIVFYHNDHCLGGGIIIKNEKSASSL